jgi:subtilase family serine protease
MLQRRRTTISSVLVLASAAVIAACSAGHQSASAVAPGTTGSVDTTGFAVPTWATPAAFVGQIDGATVLKLQVHLRMQNEDAARAQFEDINDPDSPNYGNFLTDDQFNALYAPLPADFATVQAHLTSFGLTVTEAPVNRAYVAVSGTAAQISAAFGTKIGQFNVNGTVKRAPMSAAVLPANVMPLVKGVLGLAEPMTMKPMIKRVMDPAHTGGSGGNGGTVTANTCTTYYGEITDSVDPVYPGGPDPLSYIGCGYVPSQVRAGYGFDTTLNQGIDGTGQTVAILDAFASPTLLADAQQYFKNNDPSHPLKSSQWTEYTGPGTPPPPSCETTQDAQGWYGEQSLDVEAVHAVAPGAHIAFVGAVSDSDQDLLAAINMIVTKHLATVISNSWAGAEEGGGDFSTYEAAAIQAGLKGVGLYFASGDDGDYVQTFTQYGQTGETPTVSFPTSLTQVTGVGGTSLEFAKNGGRAFETGWETGVSIVVPAGYSGTWPPSGGGGGGGGGSCSDDAGTGDDDAGQARTPFFTPMNLHDGGTATTDAGAGAGAANVWWPAAPGGFYGGAGGGTSQVYLQPKWQKGVVPNALATYNPNMTVPGAASRVVPDVGMLADPYTGYMVGMTDPVAGTYGEFPIGGTSLATPLFTASMALAQQYAGRHFGAANALIYKAAKSGGLRDVAPTASLQAVAIPTYGYLATFGYTGSENILTAAVGFDDETGLGAPNGAKFLEALKQH